MNRFFLSLFTLMFLVSGVHADSIEYFIDPFGIVRQRVVSTSSGMYNSTPFAADPCTPTSSASSQSMSYNYTPGVGVRFGFRSDPLFGSRSIGFHNSFYGNFNRSFFTPNRGINHVGIGNTSVAFARSRNGNVVAAGAGLANVNQINVNASGRGARAVVRPSGKIIAKGGRR